ncbi:hybrid sensor histidine kinase/response regulator [Paracoccus tegillarcae]|nr:hybrid sensor histidine kinase/response regulator [Paracoccus tegillarcae]
MLRDDDSADRRALKLGRIANALIERVDRLEESRGSAWSMFQAAVALEQEVTTRTAQLEQALADLSQRNRELAVARASAEEANRSKTRFLRAASHDLLQPLSAARLFLDALAGTDLDDGQQEIAARLTGAFESVEQLMHAVLDIARLDSQRIEFNRKPVAMDRMFMRLADEFGPTAEAKGLRLRFAPTSAVVDSDPVFLRRIAQNLISNAIKYTPRGGVLVGMRPRGSLAWLEVWDTGPGIPAIDRNRIFGEFQRLNSDPGAVGMGLGLSIVRRACAKLGHPLKLDSEPMRGTVFRAGLPLTAEADPMGFCVWPGHSGTLQGRLAMVIENDVGMRCGYEMILQGQLGMIARLSGGTDEALATMGDDPPDVILADYNLDDGDTGIAAINALREAAGQPIPAVMVTARRDPTIARACADIGVPLLEKPVRPADLRTMLEQLLS